MARNDDSFSEYKYSVRERATESHRQLFQTLDHDPVVSPERKRRGRSLSPKQAMKSPHSSRTPWDSVHPVEHSDYSYGAAASRLRTLLYRYEDDKYVGRKNIQFTPRAVDSSRGYAVYSSGYVQQGPPPVQFPQFAYRGDMPSPEETLLLLQNQAALNQQLEIENKYIKDELQSLKLKLTETVEENRILHEEIKRNAIQEMIQEGVDIPEVHSYVATTSMKQTVRASSSAPAGNNRVMGPQDYTKWQKELERIQSMHVAKAARLETQLQSLKEENQSHETLITDLRAKLRIMETVSGSPDLLDQLGGLCIRCAQNDAMLPSSVAHSQRRSIEQLTRERDDLIAQLATLRSKYETQRQREEEAYQQVKRSVEMVEQAQLEQAQAHLERAQAKEELENMRNRLSDHVEQITRRLTDEREIIRKEYQSERDELNLKIKELTEAFMKTDNQLEKTSRDKVALMAELEIARGHLDNSDKTYGHETSSMKVSMTSLTLERNKAVEECAKVKGGWEKYEKEKEQEKLRCKMEVENLRRRLGQAEQQLVESKEQSIALTTQLQQVEKEAHMAKLARDHLEKTRSDSVNSINKRAEQREAELNTIIDQMEVRHEQTVRELEEIIASHEHLQQKLRDECKNLANQLEDNVAKYKRDNKSLKSKNEQLAGRLKRAHDRLRELENQHSMGGLLQEKMRQRLKQMDQHSMHASQQVLDLLAREASLMRDRQTLAREVEFLRRNLTTKDVCHMEREMASELVAVNEILDNVRNDHEKLLKEEVNEEVKVMQDYAHVTNKVRSPVLVSFKDPDADKDSAGSVYSEDFEASGSD